MDVFKLFFYILCHHSICNTVISIPGIGDGVITGEVLGAGSDEKVGTVEIKLCAM